MKAAARTFNLGLGLLLTAVMLASCGGGASRKEAAANSQPKQTPAEKQAWLERGLKQVYGAPGPGMVRVYAYGNELKNPGIYYFKSVTTLETALAVLKTDEFARRLSIYNLAEGEEMKKHYKFRNLSAAEKAVVLRNNDCLYFPVVDW